MLSQLPTIIKISRPRFWLYLAGTYAVGYNLGITQPNQYLSPQFWIHLAYFLIPANLLIYGFNDLFDQDTDAHNHKKTTHEHHLQITQTTTLKRFLVGTVGITLLLLPLQPNLTAQTLLMIFLFLGTFYSTPPLRFKRHPFIDFISNCFYIIPGILGYYQASGQLPFFNLIIAASLWSWAMHLFSAIPDIHADHTAGLKTTAVLLKSPNSLHLCLLFWSTSLFLIWDQSPLPLKLIGFIYPLIPLILINNKQLSIIRIYWTFPYLNALTGFLLWWLPTLSRWHLF